MASSIAASHGLTLGSLTSQAVEQSRSVKKGSLSFAPLRPRGSAFLTGSERIPARYQSGYRLDRQNQTVRAAIVPERAAEVKWDAKRKALVEANVRSVPGNEALRLIKEEGYKFLDVRPDYEYKEARPVDSVNVQLYRAIQDWTPYKIIRRAGFAFFGIFKGTEENPNFIENVREKFPDKNARIIVACTAGGSTRPSANFAEGKQSRSLIAAYYLVVDGYKNVVHLDNGLMEWFAQEMPAAFSDN